jgi:hypothetical protein
MRRPGLMAPPDLHERPESPGLMSPGASPAAPVDLRAFLWAVATGLGAVVLCLELAVG